MENGLGPLAATLLMLVVATSSLFFKLSLTYLTTVPSTMMIAFWLTPGHCAGRPCLPGPRRQISGAAAILTRQFGAALVPALATVALPSARSGSAGTLSDRSFVDRPGDGLAVEPGLVPLELGGRISAAAAADVRLERGNVILPWQPWVGCHYQAYGSHHSFGGRRGLRSDGPFNAAMSRGGSGLRLVARLVGPCFTAAAVSGWKVISLRLQRPVRGSPCTGTRAALLRHSRGRVPEWVRWAVALLMVTGGLSLPASPPLGLWLKRRGAARAGQTNLVGRLFSCGLTLIFGPFVDQYFLVYLPCAATRRGEKASRIFCCNGAAWWPFAAWPERPCGRENLAKERGDVDPRARAASAWRGCRPTASFPIGKWLFYWEFEDYVRAGHATPRHRIQTSSGYG